MFEEYINNLNLEEIDRDDCASFIDTTPNASTMALKLLGIGITDKGIDFNPNIKSTKWVCEKNNRNRLQNNAKQSSISQTMHKGDPCFEYVYSLMDKTGKDVKSHIVDVDFWNPSESAPTSYPAKKSNCTIAITKYLGEEAVIEYTIYYNGDPIEGTVTITDGIPTFTPKAS